jgi:hypothetical protein
MLKTHSWHIIKTLNSILVNETKRVSELNLLNFYKYLRALNPYASNTYKSAQPKDFS